ncbi:MAG: hypothetical protein MMC33_002524 [Icmadophila ericetorum]|nr:hypothetical protein [Icmadophila ericetorum]
MSDDFFEKPHPNDLRQAIVQQCRYQIGSLALRFESSTRTTPSNCNVFEAAFLFRPSTEVHSVAVSTVFRRVVSQAEKLRLTTQFTIFNVVPNDDFTTEIRDVIRTMSIPEIDASLRSGDLVPYQIASDGRSIHSEAVWFGRLDALEYLAIQGISPTMINGGQVFSAFKHSWSFQHREDIFQWLVDHGCNLEEYAGSFLMLTVSPVFMEPAKMMALIEPQRWWIDLLLSHEYNMEVRNHLGETALLSNARNCGISSVEMIRLLLLAEADPNVTDS